NAGVIATDVAEKLASAYGFLRRVEHLLQYREDEQTHLLPRDPKLCKDLAEAMGMTQSDFEAQLSTHRAYVALTFRNAFRIAGMGGDDDTDDIEKPQHDAACGDIADHIQTSIGEQADIVCKRVESLLDGHRIRSLPQTSRKRLEVLLPAIVSAAAKTDDPPTTAIRLLQLVENIAQRSAYLALLAEYPETLARVARIVGASPWASEYLSRYPLLL